MRTGVARSKPSITHVPALACLIHGALPPSVSFRARSVVDALLLTAGSLGGTQQIAQRLGLGDRFALCRLLRRDGLPPFRRLRSWINVIHWSWTRSHLGHSLEHSAFVDGRTPASCYRLVRRLTGEPWRMVASRGTGWLIERFSEEVHSENEKRRHRRGGLVHLSILSRELRKPGHRGSVVELS